MVSRAFQVRRSLLSSMRLLNCLGIVQGFLGVGTTNRCHIVISVSIQTIMQCCFREPSQWIVNHNQAGSILDMKSCYSSWKELKQCPKKQVWLWRWFWWLTWCCFWWNVSRNSQIPESIAAISMWRELTSLLRPSASQDLPLSIVCQHSKI